jgi:hypothetical protein
MISRPFELFQNTPLLDRWRSLSPKRKIAISILITWIPLVILSALESLTNAQSLLNDSAINIRFLLALPLFIIVPHFTGKKLRLMVVQFTESKIIKSTEIVKFQHLIQSALKLRDSTFVMTLIWIIIYGISFYVLYKIFPNLPSTWRNIDDDQGRTMTMAGRWFLFVSQPLYYFNVFYFLYRGLLWWRFMFGVSRLDLQIRAAHGDHSGGLGFLGESIKASILPVLAISSSIAAGVSNLVLYEGLSLGSLKFTLLGLTVFLFAFFIGPLLLFIPILFSAREKAIYKYGALGGIQLQQFERKWLQRDSYAQEDHLSSGDFSTLTDTTSIISFANGMKLLPFDAKDLIPFTLAIMLPFLPVAALKVPWDVIFKQIIKFVF